ncbi:MAG: HlyD family efflux transporter periplasmic adaptor subunit [Acidobacteriota bacterium]
MKRRVIIVVAVLALVLLTAAFAFQQKSVTRGATWVEARRGDLVLGVEVTGELQSVNSVSLGPPPFADIWDYKISMMAPEGSDVHQGARVLAFDTTELARQLDEKLAERDSATTEIEKKRADLQVQSREEELKLAQAEALLRKGDLKLDAPDDIIQQNERKQIELDRANARREVAYRKGRLDLLRRSAAEEIHLLENKLQTASNRVAELQLAIGNMAVKAPRDGTVVYIVNRRNEKKKVGDAAWRGEKILEIPDLKQMRAKGEIDESDAGRISTGQRVTLRLDAHPDDEWHGTIATIARSVQRQSMTNPLKVLSTTIALDRTDRSRMRPGMRFRGTVETGRVRNALLIPLDAVITAGGRTAVRRRLGFGVDETYVELGRRNEDQVEVLRGLAPGDHILRRSEPEKEETE